MNDADPEDGTGDGFVFEAATAEELTEAAERALALYRDQPAWRALQQRGMQQDWSWRRAARTYHDLYGQAIADRQRAREEASA